MHRHARTTSIAALLIAALSACSPPKPPEEERRPEPQAGHTATQPQSAIVQTAEAYKDRARSVESQQLEAADQQRAQIEAATQYADQSTAVG